MKLEGKKALITGASSGIGAETAIRFAKEGCDLFLAGGRNKEGLEAAAKACRESGRKVIAESFDLSSLEQARLLLDRTMETLGPPDILVNCAAARGRKPVQDFTAEEIRLLFHVNSIVPYYLCGQVARHMIERGGGRILNVGSTNAEAGVPGNTLYSASKAALHGMTRALAVELGPQGIRVNAIAPGTTLSPNSRRRLEENAELRERLLADNPLGRFGEPEEMAAFALFLVSEEADYLNGEIIVIDGGLMRKY